MRIFSTDARTEPRDTKVMRGEAQRQQEQQTNKQTNIHPNKQKIHRNKRKVLPTKECVVHTVASRPPLLLYLGRERASVT